MDLLLARGEVALLHHLRSDVVIDSFSFGKIKLGISDAKLQTRILKQLGAFLLDNTGERWEIDISHELKGNSINESAVIKEESARSHPLVKRVIRDFTGARIKSIKP